MNRVALAFAGVCAAALGACSATEPMGLEPVEAAPRTATADVRNAAGASVARASATQVGDTIRLRVEATGLAPGSYGSHIHAVGRCDAPTFESAGPHWNPTERQHGRDNPAGQHMGDLPNLMVGTDGRGSFEFTVPQAWVEGGAMPMLDADGASIMIHQRPDDYRTNPSGNSGARIACGVFG